MPDTPRPAHEDALGKPGRAAGFAGTQERGRSPNNLPIELSSFLRREREVAEALLSGLSHAIEREQESGSY